MRTREGQTGPAEIADVGPVQRGTDGRGATAARRPARGPHGALQAPALPLVVALAFLPILANDFVRWDDHINFLQNPGYRGLGWSQIRWAWTTYLIGVYQPLG